MKTTNIKYCPSTLAEGFATYSPKGLRHLFDGKTVSHVLDFDIDNLQLNQEMADSTHRISVSGVQEKFPAIVDGGKIRLSGANERSTYILKPAPLDRTLLSRKEIPANEHLTMQIASQVYGIETAANGLCFTSKGEVIYITKRFDILPDGTKLPMEDFATLIGRDEHNVGTQFKYSGCYEDIALALRKNVATWKIDMERFFELVLFNYIYANGDDHMKNFSLVRHGNDYRLAPAYDLLNTCLHVRGDDFGLDGGLSANIEKSDVFLRTNHPCRLDFERFGQLIEIPPLRLEKILDKYMQLPDEAVTLTNHSFLTDKMKRYYLKIVRERIGRFKRVSE